MNISALLQGLASFAWIGVHRCVGTDLCARQPQPACKRIKHAGGYSSCCGTSADHCGRGACIPASQ